MRLKTLTALLFAAIAMVVFTTAGCDSPSSSGTGATDAGHDHDGDDHDDHDEHDGHDHDDDHAHDDHPAHGPFGGHLVELDSAEHQGEWKKYKDNDIIRMYVLDADGKKATPVKADSFIVTPLVGNEDIQFELTAEDPGEDGTSAVYMLEDKDLCIAIPLGVDIAIKVGDKTIKGQIKAHKPLDH